MDCRCEIRKIQLKRTGFKKKVGQKKHFWRFYGQMKIDYFEKIDYFDVIWGKTRNYITLNIGIIIGIIIGITIGMTS